MSEHEHLFGDRFGVRHLGVYWPIKCREEDCTFHEEKSGRVFQAGRRINCPEGCGLAYYKFEADEHSCWDS